MLRKTFDLRGHGKAEEVDSVVGLSTPIAVFLYNSLNKADGQLGTEL